MQNWREKTDKALMHLCQPRDGSVNSPRAVPKVSSRAPWTMEALTAGLFPDSPRARLGIPLGYNTVMKQSACRARVALSPFLTPIVNTDFSSGGGNGIGQVRAAGPSPEGRHGLLLLIQQSWKSHFCFQMLILENGKYCWATATPQHVALCEILKPGHWNRSLLPVNKELKNTVCLGVIVLRGVT